MICQIKEQSTEKLVEEIKYDFKKTLKSIVYNFEVY